MAEYVNVIVNGEVQSVLKDDLNIPPVTADIIRKERDAKLAETDWWALSDNTMTQAQIDYRQDLRDITDQAGFPHNVVWPTKP